MQTPNYNPRSILNRGVETSTHKTEYSNKDPILGASLPHQSKIPYNFQSDQNIFNNQSRQRKLANLQNNQDSRFSDD